MAGQQVGCFRLLDLPGEIRNKIYREILCCFDPPAPHLSEGGNECLMVVDASHSTDTSVLRTCRQVHREAYDVMVKTNQFIKVSSVDIDLGRLILGSRLPIVTMDRAITDEFQGCVMSVDLSALPGGAWVDVPWEGDGNWEDHFDAETFRRPAGTGPRFKFLILWRDWSAFCQMLNLGVASFKGFGTNVKIEITMNTYPKDLPDYKAQITDYFTVERQSRLLGDFGSLRNFFHVSITGTIDEQLALSTVQAVSRRR